MKTIISIAFKVLLWIGTHTLYTVRSYGSRHVPQKGGALIVCNQRSYLDFLFVIISTKRNVRFFVHRPLYENRFMRFVLSHTNAIPISLDDHPEVREEALASARDAIAEGHIVCLFLGLGLQRMHAMLPFNEGYAYLRQQLDVPIIPMYIDKVWGWIFLYDKGAYFQRLPKKMPYPVNVIIGSPIPANSPAHKVRVAVQELSTSTFDLRKNERKPLHITFMREAKKHPFRFCLSDENTKALTYNHALTCVLRVCKRFVKIIASGDGPQNIGILLPQSALSSIVNFAVLMSGHVPVNIGIHTRSERREVIIKQCEITRIITTKPYLYQSSATDHVQGICLSNNEVFRNSISKLLLRLMVYIFPQGILKKVFTVADHSDLNALATIMFTSGSTGEPKGIQLSHLNILSNVEGLYQTLHVSSRDVVMGTLPFDHPFGFTATLCFPIVAGLGAVYHGMPDNIPEISALIKRYHASVIIALPRTLSQYAHKCSAEDLASVKFAIVGVDKLPKQVTLDFYRVFGVIPYESYGATELSPIVSIGIPGYVSRKEYYQETAHNETNQNITLKVGYPLPGVAVKAIDPHTREPLGYREHGILMIKGANVMIGYLNDDERTKSVVSEGWYETGDIGFIDENGFIHVIDRFTRFTRVGNDDISHARVEVDIMELIGASELMCAVTSVTDDTYAERLVVLYHRSINVKKLMQDISEKVLPQRWMPKEHYFYEINEIPLLKNGKVDLVRAKEMAKDLHFINHSGRNFVEVEIMTDDNVQICLNHYKRGNTTVIIIAPGWRNAKDTWSFLNISGMFTKQYDVICLDFRGNGKSGGLYTWTVKENRDLYATIEYVKRCGYQKIGLIGFSLGAATTIIEGGTNRSIDSIIAVSPPTDFKKIDYHFWEEDIAKDMKIIFGYKGIGRTLRAGNPFQEKIKPIDVVDKISPTPFHLIHGDADWLIKPYHSKELYLKAKDPKRLTMIAGEGHADRIFDSNPKLFEKVCLEWFAETL